MGSSTSIEWTDATWGPTRGCSRVSPGCQRCYAERIAGRFCGPGKPYEGFASGGKWTGKLSLVTEHLADPIRWSKPRRVFVNSMSDLFHEELSNLDIAAVFGVMAASPQHTFQVLTKRASRMREWFDWAAKQTTHGATPVDTAEAMQCIAIDFRRIDKAPRFQWNADATWPLPNVWLGVSVESQRFADERVPELLRTPAAVRFVSYEPALGPVDFTRIDVGSPGGVAPFDALSGHFRSDVPHAKHASLDWVIIGGESGPGARRFDTEWAIDTAAACKAAGVACFIKQLGANAHHQPGGGLCRGWVPLRLKDSHGGDWDEWPEDVPRVREWPVAGARP